jgi:type IV fimbrial biogenesis protein FimT
MRFMVSVGMATTSPRIDARVCREQARGFTLVEMMVVLGILAILVTLALPAFEQLTATQQVRKAASDLQNALLIARSTAITQNRQITVHPVNGSWEAGWEVYPTADTAMKLQAGSAFGGVAISPDADITFRADGRAAAGTALTVNSNFDSPTITRYVCLDASGRPRTSEVACS